MLMQQQQRRRPDTCYISRINIHRTERLVKGQPEPMLVLALHFVIDFLRPAGNMIGPPCFQA
jgi:hypothetical protein